MSYGGAGESNKAVTEISIVSNDFSARFKGSLWQGQISGSIDESGKLVASGWVVRKQYSVTKFNIQADYIDGAFRAEFDATDIYGDPTPCRIALTRAG